MSKYDFSDNDSEKITGFVFKSFILGLLKVFMFISCIATIVGIVLAYTLFTSGHIAEIVAYLLPSGIVSYTFFATSYAVIKAAWIYIEKNKK